MTRDLTDARRWSDAGTALVRRALDHLGIDDHTWEQPSELPGWTRKHLVAHLNGNALALRNLAHWARTGVETPMYSSTDQRNADIEAGSRQPARALSDAFDQTAAALASDWEQLTEQAWQHEVRTAQGRSVPASETPWMRAREVMVHAVDLAAGVQFAELPADFAEALIDDIVVRRNGPVRGPALLIEPSDSPARWEVTGDGEPTTVVGPVVQLAAYLAGRPCTEVTVKTGDEPPALPAWL